MGAGRTDKMDIKQGHLAFDILECVKQLRDKGGFTQKQAEIQAQQIQLMKADLETHLATKQDIKLLEEDIKMLEERMNAKMDSMGDKITNRIWAIGFVILGSIFAMGRMGVFQ